MIITNPNPPTSLTANTITTTSIKFSWVAPSIVGGSPVIDYAVYWDQGVASWTFRQNVTVNSYTSSGLSTGTTYSYYVLARNAFGYSLASTAGSWLAATAPSTPAPPVTTISGSNVIISWSPAPSANGSPITSYQIAIM